MRALPILILIALFLAVAPAHAEPREEPPKIATGVNAWGAQPALLWLSVERWHAAEPPKVAVKRERRSKRVEGSGACGGDLPPCSVMMCESGGSLTAENPRSTASGKWQVLDSTWNGYGGYDHAADAPESVQDERARQIYAGGAGRSQWVC